MKKKYIYVVHPGDGRDDLHFLSTNVRKVRKEYLRGLLENSPDRLDEIKDEMEEVYIERVKVYEV